MIIDDPHDCPECGTRRVDVLPSRGDCQTCLKARLAALDWFAGAPVVNEIIRLGEELAKQPPARYLTVIADQRHDWHCPCVACRIDRGEE